MRLLLSYSTSTTYVSKNLNPKTCQILDMFIVNSKMESVGQICEVSLKQIWNYANTCVVLFNTHKYCEL